MCLCNLEGAVKVREDSTVVLKLNLAAAAAEFINFVSHVEIKTKD